MRWPQSKSLAILITASGQGLLTLAAFYPGLLSRDSIAQLTEARSGVYSDWHPPLMSALWRIFDGIWAGPAGLLLFHNLVFWSGLAILATLAEAEPSVLLIGLVPPVLGLLGDIWKDVGMGACLIFTVALLRLAERRASKVWPLLAAGLALFYASAVRHNAAIATFPLCLWAGLLLTEQVPSSPRPRPWHALVNGLAVFLAITLSASAANFALTTRQTFPVQQILLHDLTAISLEKGQLLFPADLRPPDLISVADLAPLYSTSEVVPLYGPGRFPTLLDSKSVAELQKTWTETIPKYPSAYFKHRFRIFQQLLGIKRKDVCLPYQYATDQNSLGIESPANAFHRAVMTYLGWFRNSILFRGWIYFLLSAALLLALGARAALRRRLPSRAEAGAWAVAASGTLYISTEFFIAPTCDFRMYWWTVLSILIFPFVMETRDRLRIWYRLLPNLKSLVTREETGYQPPGRRLALFAHYDEMNRVSDAVLFYLRSLQEIGIEVHFISTNDLLPATEVAKVLPFCSKAILRKNVGIDFGSWRVGLSRVDLKNYDQLVLANDSVFGPLQPLAPIFSKMEGYDFWGMTESLEGGRSHLQSYFLVFGPRAFLSLEFKRFWTGFRFYLRKSSYIRRCEIGLSKHAANWKTAAYIGAQQAAAAAVADPNFARYRTHPESVPSLNPTLFLWDILIRDLGFPFLKVELPKLNRLKMANVVGWRKVIEESSSYDPRLIENALERRTGPREAR